MQKTSVCCTNKKDPRKQILQYCHPPRGRVKLSENAFNGCHLLCNTLMWFQDKDYSDINEQVYSHINNQLFWCKFMSVYMILYDYYNIKPNRK